MPGGGGGDNKETSSSQASLESSSSIHEGIILECDYDTQVTKLYRSIEERNWEEVLYFLETKKWYSTSWISNFWGDAEEPPAAQARTWVTAMDSSTSAVRWCQLPIHASITFNAPFSIIAKLVEVYPRSVRCADDQDMLPLHYAFRFGADDDVLLFLLERFPQAVSKKAVKDRLPLDLAQYGPRPERGSIIDYYMQSAVRNAKNEWDGEYETMVANMKGVADHELQHHLKAKTQKLVTTMAELNTTKKQVAALQRELTEAKRELKENSSSGRSGLKRSMSGKSPNSSKSTLPPDVTESDSDVDDDAAADEEASEDESEEHQAIKAPKRTTITTTSTSNSSKPTRMRSLSQPRRKPDEGSRRSARTGDTSRRSKGSKGKRSVDDLSSRRSIKSTRSSSKGPKSRNQIKKPSANLFKMLGIKRG